MIALPLLVLPLLVTAPPGSAEDRAPAAELGMEDAVERVQTENQARVLAAQELHVGTKKIYRIKFLTADGRVRAVHVPADRRDKVGPAATAEPSR